VSKAERDANIKFIGNVGEHILKTQGSKWNRLVIMSDDEYDPVKDMNIDSFTAEVKTLTLIQNYNAFFLERKQQKKCFEVDRLFFVEMPMYTNWPIYIYESMQPRKENSEKGYINSTAGRFFKLTNLHIVDIIDSRDWINLLRSKSISDYVYNYPATPEQTYERKQLISKLPRSFI
jgi:hypothetical protein